MNLLGPEFSHEETEDAGSNVSQKPLESKINDAVVTVPSSFNDQFKQQAFRDEAGDQFKQASRDEAGENKS